LNKGMGEHASGESASKNEAIVFKSFACHAADDPRDKVTIRCCMEAGLS
jgi:hypothetical protein